MPRQQIRDPLVVLVIKVTPGVDSQLIVGKAQYGAGAGEILPRTLRAAKTRQSIVEDRHEAGASRLNAEAAAGIAADKALHLVNALAAQRALQMQGRVQT